jgi:hypothetical protein
MARQTIQADGKLDIHDLPARLVSQKKRLECDPSISPENKTLILEFIRDCELGKTLLDRQRKKVGMARLVKYLIHLRSLATWFGKDFNQVTQKDMEDFVLKLENDRIRKPNGGAYAETVKRDYKICIRKLYKWLLGNNEFYPDIVRWLDTRVNPGWPPHNGTNLASSQTSHEFQGCDGLCKPVICCLGSRSSLLVKELFIALLLNFRQLDALEVRSHAPLLGFHTLPLSSTGLPSLGTGQIFASYSEPRRFH